MFFCDELTLGDFREVRYVDVCRGERVFTIQSNPWMVSEPFDSDSIVRVLFQHSREEVFEIVTELFWDFDAVRVSQQASVTKTYN